MKRYGKILRGWAFPFLSGGGGIGAVALVLTEHARIAALLTALFPLAAGAILGRLTGERGRREELQAVRRQIRNERRLGRLCVALGLALIPIAWLAPSGPAIVACLLLSLFIAQRSVAIMADTALSEGDLEIAGASPAQECSWVELWGLRLGTMPGRLPQYLARIANAKAPMGQVAGLRALPIVLAVSAVLVFGTIGTALGVGELMKTPDWNASTGEADSSSVGGSSVAEGEEKEGAADEAEVEEEKTYAELCPELPDPLDIEHGLGKLFRYDGGFKAGCGTEAEHVAATGVWFAAGMCAGQLRSAAVKPPGGDAVLLYGSAARFAWDAAQRGELVAAEGARPDGGDVYVVETFDGAYGFARQPLRGDSAGTEVRDCTDVTTTARPFAELPPPMLRLWRDLVERRAAWSWPGPEGPPREAFFFAAHSSAAETAHGACASELSCYLEVDGETWTAEETAYVSLEELAPFMPPSPDG